MNLTETPEIVVWKATHYVFVEKVGPFMNNAPQAWGEAHAQLEALTKHNEVTGYLSLYRVPTQVYRAGVSLDAPPVALPVGLSYELFAGGKYIRFVLTGPYTLLPQASGRVFEIVLEQGIEQRDDYCIEHYVNDPRVTPAEDLKTEILIPTA